MGKTKENDIKQNEMYELFFFLKNSSYTLVYIYENFSYFRDSATCRVIAMRNV